MRKFSGARRCLVAVLVGALLFAAEPSSAQRALGIQATDSAAAFARETGKRFTFVCPPSEGKNGLVFGTETYMENSAICGAAIHAGVLKPGATGAVSIVMGSGAESFVGSERNGVTSQRFGASRASFTFPRTRSSEPGLIAWRTVWNLVPENFIDPVTVACPEGGNLDAPIWGTDVYITDSSICVAAVHAGLISAEKGGAFTVARTAPLSRHLGSERNGVVSRTWGAWKDAFSVKPVSVIVAETSSPPPPPAESDPADVGEPPIDPPDVPSPPPSGLAPRTLQVAGFTASGVAPPGNLPLAPRTLQVDGFTAIGVALINPPSGLAPRTVTIAGFTASGVTSTP